MSGTYTTNVLSVDRDEASFFSVTVHIVQGRRKQNTTRGRRRQRSPIKNRTSRKKNLARRCKLDQLECTECGVELVGGGVVRGGNARRLPTRTRGQHGSRALYSIIPRTAIEGRKKARFTGGKTVVSQTILGDVLT